MNTPASARAAMDTPASTGGTGAKSDLLAWAASHASLFQSSDAAPEAVTLELVDDAQLLERLGASSFEGTARPRASSVSLSAPLAAQVMPPPPRRHSLAGEHPPAIAAARLAEDASAFTPLDTCIMCQSSVFESQDHVVFAEGACRCTTERTYHRECAEGMLQYAQEQGVPCECANCRSPLQATFPGTDLSPTTTEDVAAAAQIAAQRLEARRNKLMILGGAIGAFVAHPVTAPLLAIVGIPRTPAHIWRRLCDPALHHEPEEQMSLVERLASLVGSALGLLVGLVVATVAKTCGANDSWTRLMRRCADVGAAIVRFPVEIATTITSTVTLAACAVAAIVLGLVAIGLYGLANPRGARAQLRAMLED